MIPIKTLRKLIKKKGDKKVVSYLNKSHGLSFNDAVKRVGEVLRLEKA
jgi:hypothetical protein